MPWAFVLIVLTGLLLTSCENKRPPSLLVIAVDSLPFNISLCTKDDLEVRAGFRVLCEESIRFTHAMTPSPLSVPTLASLLTGQYPFQHGVHHNGAPGLSPRSHTFAEAAVRKGYRTAFFSGGAPVWRRTGLHQGFEHFDDLLSFSTGRLFRPMSESKELFKNWLLDDVGSDPFVSVWYAPDLNFTDTVTENISGELRSLSYDSQIEEMDETLEELIVFLKKENRWNDTLVVLVGLNGRELSPREGQIEPLNLHSENMQVTLLVKPAQKPRDEALSWAIDRNVSLTDLGRTLLEIFEPSLDPPAPSDFPVVSLFSSLTNAQVQEPEERSLLMESGWGPWQGLSGLRAAVLKKQELNIYDREPQTYNTLTDRFELMPLEKSGLSLELTHALRKVGFRPWNPLSHSLQKSFSIPSLYWLSPGKSLELHRALTILSQDPNSHPRILRWAAQTSLEQKDWRLLKILGKRAQQVDWIGVADRNMGKNVVFQDSCLALFQKAAPSVDDTKRCPDELTLSLHAATHAKQRGDGNRDVLRRRFLQAWDGAQLDLRILKANAALGLVWLPQSAEMEIPSKTALALALPENR